mgnify:FL=1|jgi:hypothetical protein
MSRKLYHIILCVLTLGCLALYITGNLGNNWLFFGALVLGEVVVLLRRRYLGLPLYPFTPKEFARDFRERFSKHD